jgi:hypothetical protein
MRKSKYSYIDNVSLFCLRPKLLALCLQIPVRTIYTLRNNRLRHGNAPEVLRDLHTLTPMQFLKRYGMKKHEMRKGWNANEETVV